MLGRRSSSIQMGFRTLCMVYSTGREISKGEWREKAGEIFLKITNIFNVSSKNSGVLLLRTLFQFWAVYWIQTYGNATIPSPPPVMCLQTYGEALIEYFTLCQMKTRSIFFHPTLQETCLGLQRIRRLQELFIEDILFLSLKNLLSN